MTTVPPSSQTYCGDQMGECKWNALATLNKIPHVYEIHQGETTFTLELISKNTAFVSISKILIGYSKVLKIMRGMEIALITET